MARLDMHEKSRGRSPTYVSQHGLRDRLAYSELTAAIILIGVLGYALDWLARAAHARWMYGAPAASTT